MQVARNVTELTNTWSAAEETVFATLSTVFAVVNVAAYRVQT